MALLYFTILNCLQLQKISSNEGKLFDYLLNLLRLLVPPLSCVKIHLHKDKRNLPQMTTLGDEAHFLMKSLFDYFTMSVETFKQYMPK